MCVCVCVCVCVCERERERESLKGDNEVQNFFLVLIGQGMQFAPKNAISVGVGNGMWTDLL